MRHATISLILSLLLITSFGACITMQMMNEEADYLQEHVLSQARVASWGVNVSKVMALTGSPSDLETPEYQDLKDLMTEYYEDMPGIRFVYIVGMLDNGTPFFYVDSEPPDSPDYSPPGQLYYDVPDCFDRSFQGEELVTGPQKDRWGEWITAMVPLRDPLTDEVVAVLCVDLEASIWDWTIVMGGLPYALTTILIAALVTTFYFIGTRQEKEGLRQAQAAKELRQANDKISIMNSITRHDINNQVTVLNGYLSLAREKVQDQSVLEYIDKMTHAVMNIEQHIGFTKDYQDIGVKTPVWANVHDQLRAAFGMLNPTGVELDDDAEDLEILADPLVGKVYYNLIDNSIRHGKNVKNIKVSVVEEGNGLKIIYTDDGVGISDTVRKRLFKGMESSANGLGLILIRDILAITGITIEEKGEGSKGARFIISVPANAWRRGGNKTTASSGSEGPH